MDAETITVINTVVMPGLATALVGVTGLGVALLYKKLGIDRTQADIAKEAQASTALQGALTTAIGLATTQGKSAAINYVLSEVPNAIAHFDLKPNDIATRIEGKTAAATLPVVVGTSDAAAALATK